MASTTTTRKGRPGGDHRGSAAARRARKWWMLATWGTGAWCRCVHCGAVVHFATVEADRKDAGASYARHNVQPSCKPCNLSRSNRDGWAGPEARSAACLALADTRSAYALAR